MEHKLRVDVALAAHKFSVARGEYIAKDIVRQEWRKGVVAVKNRFLGLGRGV